MSLMVYNLGGIRRAVFQQADWAPSTSEEAKQILNGFINRAYFILVEEAPFLFFRDVVQYAIEPGVEMGGTTDTLSVVGGDAWVLQTDLLVGADGRTVWSDNRDWSGRDIELYDEDAERWLSFKIREVWTNLIGTRTLVSLDRPWRDATATGLSWRVDTHTYPLPRDIVEVRSFTLSRGVLDQPLEVIGEQAAEEMELHNSGRLLMSGVPRWVFRREHRSLRAPTLKPLAKRHPNGKWGGPEPAGIFEYLYTYVWGKHEYWLQGGPLEQGSLEGSDARRVPWLESPPSPESDEVDVTAGGTVLLTLPNIDHMLGFDDVATSRYRRAGVKKRIYRRRSAVEALAATVIETPNTYFLLDEVDGHETTYEDAGEVTPDYLCPLQVAHGYETVRFWPTPDTVYTLNIRCVRRPPPLTDDQDTPAIHEDGITCLIDRALALLHESEGAAERSKDAIRRYEAALFVLGKRYGDLRPKSKVRHRRVARIGRGGLRRQFVVSDA